MDGGSFVRCFVDGELDASKLRALRRAEDELLQSSIKIAAAVEAPVDVNLLFILYILYNRLEYTSISDS